MATILYGVSGEGRGHATRTRTIVEMLRKNHRVVLYSYDFGYEILRQAFDGTDLEVREIPGLRFHYSADRRLAVGTTALAGLGFIAKLPEMVAHLEQEVENERPDLVITDFEPTLPRAARRCGVPFISLDHQHFLVTYDLGSLPLGLRLRAKLISVVVRIYHWGQAATIVSSFYFPPLRRGCEDVIQIGVLLRDEVLNAPREEGDHLVAYLRRFASPNLLEALKGTGLEIRIYGLGRRPDNQNLRFREVSEEGFIQDLASARALISTAGNQVVGEALYLGKPVFAMPETGNYEQHINAHFLQDSGAGVWYELEGVTAAQLNEFIDRIDEYRERIDIERVNGNARAVELIERYLGDPAWLRNAARRPRPRRASSTTG